MADRPYVVEENGEKAVFSDSAIVRWDKPLMRCSCTQAARRPADEQMCKHILTTVRTGRDRLLGFPTTGIVLIKVPVTILDANRAEVAFAKIMVDEAPTGDPVQGLLFSEQVVGYVTPHLTSRNDVRTMIWPYILEMAQRCVCDNCGVPEPIEAWEADALDKDKQVMAVRTFLGMNDRKLCPKCQADDDLVPKV